MVTCRGVVRGDLSEKVTLESRLDDKKEPVLDGAIFRSRCGLYVCGLIIWRLNSGRRSLKRKVEYPIAPAFWMSSLTL